MAKMGWGISRLCLQSESIFALFLYQIKQIHTDINRHKLRLTIEESEALSYNKRSFGYTEIGGE